MNENERIDLGRDAPDYSKSTKEFTTWAYSSTYDGWWQTLDENKKFVRLENSEETPVAVTTKETLQEYKDAGFNTLFINYVFPYRTLEERFETSRTKQIMDWAAEVGLKCIIFDGCTRELASTQESLINPEKANGKRFFNSQEELNEYVAYCMKNVIKHPAFYGISILDEPTYKCFPAFGQVYKAVQACAPGAYVCMNLLGLAVDGKFTSSVLKYCEGAWDMTAVEGYTKYVTHYADCTGAPYIQADVYPMRLTPDGKPSLTTNALNTPRFLAEFCKKRDMELHYVLQTSAFSVGFGDNLLPWLRAPNKKEMYWQVNIAMAFGVTSYSYWNYYPVVNTASEHYDEKSSFLDIAGNKNDMYYWMQDIHKEMQKMAKVLLCFKYENSGVFCKEPIAGARIHINGLGETTFTKLSKVNVETAGAILVTEMYDKANSRFGYFIVNVTDPVVEGGSNVTLKFDEFDKVQIWNKGEVEKRAIENNALRVEFEIAQGIFVIPY